MRRNTILKKELKALLPNNFFDIINEHIIDSPLYPYQEDDLAVELEDILFGYGNSLTRERARQTGKTTSITILAYLCMVLLPELAKNKKYIDRFPSLELFEYGFTIGIVAPKIEQAKITMKRMKKISLKKSMAELFKMVGVEVTNRSLTSFVLSNGSSLVAMSGNPISVTEGESLHLLIFDEAHKIVSYSWHKAYSPMVSSTNGTIVSFGIAWTAKLAFYNQIQKNKKNGHHSRVTYEEAQKYSSNYKKWIEKELTRISKDSVEFQLNFLLEWLLKTGNPITPEIWDNIDMLDDYLPGEITSNNLYVGIDWGKTGTNTFAVLVEKTTECIKLIDLLELWGENYPAQHIKLQNFINKYPEVKRIWSESTGVGDTNTDFLKAEFGSKVIGVTAFNLPTLHDKLLNEINYKRLIRPKVAEEGPWVSLTRQFLNCEKRFSGSSFKLIAPDDELDDAIDGTSLAVGAALNDHLFDFTYIRRSTRPSRVMQSSTKRLITTKKNKTNATKYQQHLSRY